MALGLLAFGLATLACSGFVARGAKGRPRLVVMVVVDQLRPDRISPGQPNGFGRLLREGRVFTRASLDYAFSETCPGHATAATGRLPRHHGIVSNYFFPPGSLEATYCVEDASDAGQLRTAGVDGPGARAALRVEDGRSPSLLERDTLSEWLAAARPGSRFESVAGKDRSAILLGGRGAAGAWWLESRFGGALTTSRSYRDTLPEWAAAWDRARVRRDVPDRWVHPAHDPTGRTRDDDYPAEDPRASRTSPHPLVADDPAAAFGLLAASPELDRIVLEVALEIVDQERLGRGEHGATDVLAIGLSGTDYIGHLYGPDSQESRDALARLDEALGAFLAALEKRFGPDGFGVALTADHGVLPLPEWVQEAELPENGCPVDGGRISESALWRDAEAATQRALGRDGEALGPWWVAKGPRVRFNAERLAATGVSPQRLAEVIREAVVAQPGIAGVYAAPRATRPSTAVDSSLPAPIQRLIANSMAPGRAPDLVVVTDRGCLLSDHAFGTSHGSPYDYDRRIPLVFWGPGVVPGRDDAPAHLVDLAPTLAAWLEIPFPRDLDGRVLPLR